MTKPTKPQVTPDPKLRPLVRYLDPLNVGPATALVGSEGDDAENFTLWRSENWRDLTTIARDLARVYAHAGGADSVSRDLAHQVTQHGLTGEDENTRENMAIACVVIGAEMVQSAILCHMRESHALQRSACVCARSGLECAARAAKIALGFEDEATAFFNAKGEKVPQLSPGNCFPILDDFIGRRSAAVSKPSKVYGWLCGHTHLSLEDMKNPPSAADTFAALDHVAWVLAVLAELVLGVSGIVNGEPKEPTPLPWA